MRSNKQNVCRCVLSCLLGIVVLIGSASAQTYPNRPIKWIVSAPAGSPIDAMARKIADTASPKLGQPIVIENKPGANGSIAAAEVARAMPDGYIFLYCIGDAVVAAVAVVPSLSYDPLRDFLPLMRVSTGAPAIIAHPSIKASNMKEFVSEAKGKSPPFAYASWGRGSFPHQIIASYAKKSEIQLLQVPYRGSPPAVQDVIAGQAALTMTAPSVAASLIADGRVKALAVMGRNRSPALPNVPTMAELGYDDFVFLTDIWTGLFAPANMRSEIVNRMRSAVLDALKDPSTIQILNSNDQIPVGNSSEEFKKELATELSIIPDLIRKLD